MFAVEKNVPYVNSPRNGKCKYPFSDMAVGDSFFVPTEGSASLSGSVRCAAVRYANKAGVKFSVRSVIENDVIGVRCWRVA